MVQIEFSQLAADSLSLRIGCVVRYGDAGPVRFVTLVIDDLALDWQAMVTLSEWVSRQLSRHLDAEHDVGPDPQDPLF